jgi:hypothetical protein
LAISFGGGDGVHDRGDVTVIGAAAASDDVKRGEV